MLERAYDDARGVTAAFNLNLLHRMNRELDADFDVDGFKHRAVYNEGEHCIEMHLVSRHFQQVHIAGRTFRFRAGETIHTESSYKYSLPQFAALARRAHWGVERSWTDPQHLFSVQMLRVI